MSTWTVRRVLDWTRGFFAEKGIDSARFDAELLVAYALGIERIHLYTDHDRPLAKPELAAIRALVRRRGQCEPAAYIIGTRHFWKHEFAVDARVLVPRPETELLVERALDALPEGARVVDVGTGSGCIALSIAADRPDVQIVAIDASDDALAVARANAARLGVEGVDFVRGLGLDPVTDPVDLVVSNPPYIPSADIEDLMPDVRDHEPRQALDGGADGLDVVRALLADAPEHLSAGGRMLIEIGYDQGPAVRALAEADGRYTDISVRPDLAGHDRVLEVSRA